MAQVMAAVMVEVITVISSPVDTRSGKSQPSATVTTAPAPPCNGERG